MSKFISDSIYYTSSTYVLQLALFFINIVTKQILGPTQLGVWAFMQIILTYMSVVDLGVIDAGWKEIAYSYNKDDVEKPKRYMSSMLGYNMVTSCGVSFMVILYALLFLKHNLLYFYGFLYLAFAFPILRLNNCFVSYFRAVSRFRLLSKFNVISMLMNSFLGIALVYLFGLHGLYLSAFLGLSVLFLLWQTTYRKSDRIRFDFRLAGFVPLLRIGIPMAIGGALFTLMRSMDLLFVKRLLGDTMLGFYAMGFSLANYIFILPTALSTVLFSRFQHEFARSDKTENGRDGSIFVTGKNVLNALAFVIIPLVLASCYFFSGFIITSLAPKFSSELSLMKIIILGIFPLALIHIPNQLLITQNKFKTYILVSLGSSVLLFIVLFVITRVSMGAIQIAIGTAVAYAGYFTVSFFTGFRGLRGTKVNYLLYLATIAYTCSAILLIDWLPIGEIMYIPLVIVTFLRIVAFIILFSPILIYYQTKTQNISRLFGLVRNKFALQAQVK